ncbi:MAG TPA: hypothetical protein VMO17_02335 [Terriglobia bacterium]|nr:hypothetical protein [Terriglobia bacterium]
MSLSQQLEMSQENAAGAADGRHTESAEAPLPASTEAQMRRGFYTKSRAEAMALMEEDVQEYLELKESLTRDIEPRPGYETQLVSQLNETLWEMRRSQGRREGLAVRRMQGSLLGENLLEGTHAVRAVDNLEPFERLQAALSRRGVVSNEEEIQAFANARQDDSSPMTQEFLSLLASLLKPMEDRERKAVLRRARKQLRELVEPVKSVAWVMTRRANRVDSPENLAALAAPEDETAELLRRVEESQLRQLWRLTNTLAKVREGALPKKDIWNEAGMSMKTKGGSDKEPDWKPDIPAKLSKNRVTFVPSCIESARFFLN